jgi:integrase
MSKRIQTVQTKSLKSILNIPFSRQICVTKTKGAKNLAAAENQTQAAEISPKADVKGIIAKYLAYLEREGYAKDITYPKILHTLHKRGANLYDPESVKQTIARQRWKDGYKLLAVYAYDAFCAMEKITWERPEYRQEDAIVFVPDEKELDQLIAACRSRRMSTFLQCLKETYADPTEILRLKWIDLHENILTINAPVKRHLPGQVTISNKLVSMLNSLPRKSERIFPTDYKTMRMCFNPVRNKAAIRLQNPRLRAITFKSFRHWGGTMLAHYTNGNVLTIKKALRHRAIQSTMKYIGLLQFKDEDYEVATATTVKEIEQLAQAGFQKFDELNGIHIFRKPKKFSA